jgi:hypothetical protein
MVPPGRFLNLLLGTRTDGLLPYQCEFGVQVVEFRCNASWIGARLYQAGGLRIAKTATYP